MEARPPSVGYRLRKFVRRNRGPGGGRLAHPARLVGGLIGTAYGVIEAGNQRLANSLRRAGGAERDAAEVARRRGEAARREAEAARDGEKAARAEVDREKEKLAVFEYGRTMQVAHQEWRDNNVLAARGAARRHPADLRGWEWHYVHRLCHADLLTLKGHAAFVVLGGVQPGRDAGGDRESTTGRPGCGTPGPGPNWSPLKGPRRPHVVTSAAFSPDGARVVTASDDRTARVWDARTGAELLALKGHTGPRRRGGVQPGRGAGGDRGGTTTARVWDARTGAEVCSSSRGTPTSVRSAAFSPDGARVVTASADGTARVWDARTGAELLALKGHTGDV